MGQILESEIEKKEEKAGIEHPRKSLRSFFGYCWRSTLSTPATVLDPHSSFLPANKPSRCTSLLKSVHSKQIGTTQTRLHCLFSYQQTRFFMQYLLHKHLSNLFDWIHRSPFALFSTCRHQDISRKSFDQTNQHSFGQTNAFSSDSHFDKSLHNTVHHAVQFAEQFCMPNAKEPISLEHFPKR